MKKFFVNNWPVITIFLLSFLTTWPLFVPGYFSHHDDLHVMRIFEMRKCFNDFQIPCRWVPDMGFGFGYPIFNFYGVFPYYLGAIVSFILGYIGAAKLLFFLPLVFGGIGMYFFARQLFGKIPGFVAGILYLFAPYRALDAYVRGALGESFALAIIPFVFYFATTRNFLAFTLTTFIFLISHNIMTLIFTPIIIIWAISKRMIKPLILAFGLAAFFLLPAFFEKNLVQTESLTRAELDFRSQFVKVSQLFVDRSWHYSGSAPLSDSTISYQIGWPHWWLVVLSVFAIIFAKKRKYILHFTFFILLFVFSVFMTHNKSAPVWEMFNVLSFVQFPWRFLSIVIFSASLLGGYVAFQIKNKWMMVLIVILTILLNWSYFRPEHFYYEVTDETKLTGESFREQQKGALLDYLPKTAVEPREGAIYPLGFINNSNHWEMNVNLNEDSKITIPVFFFPGWKVNYPYKLDEIGRVVVELPKGTHKIEGRFKNTPIRTLANTITIVSLMTLVFVYVKKP